MNDHSPGSPAPLVSCVMPTHNRRRFVPLAVQHFLAQDYPNRELVVLDDGSDPVADLVSGAPGVRYFRLPGRVTTGEKRALGCSLAAGALIAHWDDDDWYSPRRLSYQVEPVLADRADITGLIATDVLVLPEGAFWGIGPALHQQMFAGDVAGGTLLFRKSLVADGVGYPPTNVAEDADFLRAAVARGARLHRVDRRAVFVYVRHDKNSWNFVAGKYLDPGDWYRTDRPEGLSPEALERYQKAAQMG